ncbi:MAG: 50S ribosomal protein L22 [Candidatus Pacebacteria bacterium]|nr:50S ribosomal protein L22 [Candidatus Paceibacterota bacterium]
MEVKASLKYLRISPRKVRLLTNLIKGLSVKSAEANLLHISKRSSKPLLKLLKSAMANAEHNFNLDKDNLFVRAIRVDEGPALKKWRPRARGAAYPIRKRTSHIFLTLKEIKEKETIIKKEVKDIKHEKKIEEKKARVKSSAFVKKSEFKKEEKIIKRSAQKQKIFRRKAI